MSHRIAPLALIASMLIAASAHAAVITQYTFASNTSATTVDANVTAGAFSHDFKLGAGAETTDVGRSSSQALYFVRGNRTDGSDEATALTAEDYMTFTVTPGSGYKMDLGTLTFLFDAEKNSTSPNVAYPASTTVFVRTSVDGFATNIPGSLQTSSFPNSSTNPTQVTVTATFGSSYDALTAATEFRLYIFDNQTTDQFFTRVDTVTLNGDVLLIPEPAALALVALGSLFMLPRRRNA